jgi:hypothetical protein
VRLSSFTPAPKATPPFTDQFLELPNHTPSLHSLREFHCKVISKLCPSLWYTSTTESRFRNSFLSSHIQITDLSCSDILSFYKEELAGETVNHISILAGCDGKSKKDTLRRMVHDTADAHNRVLEILASHRDAYDAYWNFSRGYVGFHAGSSRYRLDELAL